MKRVPPSLFLITFACGAWRVKLTFGEAVEEAKFGGAICCARASEARPHGATITEYTRVAEAASAKRRPIVDLERLKSKVMKPRGGLVVIDGGKSR